MAANTETAQPNIVAPAKKPLPAAKNVDSQSVLKRLGFSIHIFFFLVNLSTIDCFLTLYLLFCVLLLCIQQAAI